MFEKILMIILEEMDPKKRDVLVLFAAFLALSYYLYRYFGQWIARHLLLFMEGKYMDNGGFFVLFLLVMVFIIFIAILLRLSADKPISPATYGTSHFATSQEAAAFFPTTEEVNDEPWLIMGTTRNGMMAISPQQQESHVFMVAPSGQGKTSGIIINNLLREAGNRSLFINDVKFELIQTCAGWLEKRYHCLFLTPTKPATSHHYNPLAHVNDMKDAQQLAACLVKNTGESKEAFWNNVAELLLTASILHVKERDTNAPFSTLVQLLLSTPLDELKQHLLTSPSLLARSVSTSLLNNLARNERLAGSIMIELASRLYHMAEPNITEVTSSDDIDFDAFVATPTAVFISVHPSEAEEIKWFTSAFTMQLMKHLSKTAEQTAKRRLPRPVALYLDEFGNHYIPHFPDYISLVRSVGISIIMAVQSLSQLQARYGEEAKDTILANATTHIVFPGCGLPECMYYSERLGDTTVETTSKSTQGMYLTVSHSNTRRRLMTPDEIRRMPERTVLVVISNHAPLKVRNHAYFTNEVLLKRSTLPYNLPYHAILPPISPSGPGAQTPQAPNTQGNSLFLP
jgi:type IV secretion system protein VirD4